MLQVNIPANFDRAIFNGVVRDITDGEAAEIAMAHPDQFRDCFSLFGSAPKPAPARPKPPAQPINKAALFALALAYVKDHPRSKAEDVAAYLCPPGYDPKRFARAVRDALEAHVDSKALCCEGERRGRKYFPPSKANGAGEVQA